MSILAKLIIWLLLYPLTLLGFLLFHVYSLISFLFNSPVDVWHMIGQAAEEETKT